ncbi:hypothetical protein AUJ66_01575 [Candidatus Desantisbacteria bacterium CG1_02_38_46]|uniref:Putative Flp pilus-assembly TadG-like N-terminal domain-containing protein n=1 Tax=Candidatus Desantisbacteria bacterium CG1_02_38_46 TaxID=1817893 RepID=A0A1J4SIJ7_9BACT|nr:MAG: hypothetical protein AUJ66_01575 [Candidatus Desantisbacteria bacterium CG1_02_38_46]
MIGRLAGTHGVGEIIGRINKTKIKDENGQALLFTAIFLVIFVVCFLGVFNIGQLVTQKMKMQNAVDAAAQTAALWQARGLNLEGHLNAAQEALYWSYVGALAILQPEIAAKVWQTSSKITKIQEKIVQQFPYYAMASAFSIARKNGADFAYPVNKLNPKIACTLGIKKTNKIPLIKNAFTIYALDVPKYWAPQEKKGPYVTFLAYKKTKGLIGIELFQMKNSGMWTIASAKPKYKYEMVAPQGKVKAGWRAILMPVRLQGEKR